MIGHTMVLMASSSMRCSSRTQESISIFLRLHHTTISISKLLTRGLSLDDKHQQPFVLSLSTCNNALICQLELGGIEPVDVFSCSDMICLLQVA